MLSTRLQLLLPQFAKKFASIEGEETPTPSSPICSLYVVDARTLETIFNSDTTFPEACYDAQRVAGTLVALSPYEHSPRQIRFLNAETREAYGVNFEHSATVWRVRRICDFSGDDKGRSSAIAHCVSSSNDGSLLLWNAYEGTKVGRIRTKLTTCDVAYVGSRSWTVSGGYGNYGVVFADVERMTVLKTVTGVHQKGIWCVEAAITGGEVSSSFSDGSEVDLVMSASVDQTARVWDCRTMESVMCMRHSDQARSITSCLDQNLYVVQLARGLTVFWDSRIPKVPKMTFRPHSKSGSWACDVRRVTSDSFVSVNGSAKTVRYDVKGKILAECPVQAASVGLYGDPMTLLFETELGRADRDERIRFILEHFAENFLFESSGDSIMVRLSRCLLVEGGQLLE